MTALRPQPRCAPRSWHPATRPARALALVCIGGVLLAGVARSANELVEPRVPAEFGSAPETIAAGTTPRLEEMDALLAAKRWDAAFELGMHALGWGWSPEDNRATRSQPLAEELAWFQRLIPAGERIEGLGINARIARGRIEIETARHGADAPELIEPLADLAEALFRRTHPPPTDYAGSLRAADQALALAQRHGLGAEPAARKAALWRTRTLWHLQRRDESIAALDALLLSSARDPRAAADLARARGIRAWQHLETGDSAAAEAFARQSADYFRTVAATEPLELARALNRLGVILQARGESAAAIACLTEAAPLFDAEVGWREGLRHAVWFNLGEALLGAGRFAEAETSLRMAMEVSRRSNPDLASWNYLGPLRSVIVARRLSGDLAGAEALCDEALGLLPKNSVALDLEHATLHRLAAELAEQRGLSPASHYAQALAVALPVEGPPSPLALEISVARLRARMLASRDAGGGNANLREAETLARQIEAAGPPARVPRLALLRLRTEFETDTNAVLEGIARWLRESQGVATAAERLAFERARLWLRSKHRNEKPTGRELAAFLQETGTQLAAALAFPAESRRLAAVQGFDVYAPLCEHSDATLLATAVLRRKGLVFESLLEDDALRRAAAARPGAAAALQHWHELAVRSGAAVPASWSSYRPPPPGPTLDATSTAALENATGVTLWSHRALRTDPAAVQRALPADAALIEFFRYRIPGTKLASPELERYGAVILRAALPPVFVPLPHLAPDTFDHRLGRFATDLHSQGAEMMLEEMSRKLLHPCLAALNDGPPVRTLLLSPEGGLHRVPFAALPDETGRPIVERFTIAYVSSGRDLLLPVAPVSHDELAIVAAPAFGAKQQVNIVKTDQPRYRDLRLDPLPGSANEAAQLAALWRRRTGRVAQVSLGADADERGVRALNAPRWLHFSTHGFVLPTPGHLEDETGWFANPMERAGLALSGAAATLEAWDRGERPAPETDGILTAADAGALELHGTELVVLAACDSALGETRSGEGVMGLRRGFLRAGAQQLLMALAPVDDAAGAATITEFYARLFEGESAPEALAQVQRKALAALPAGASAPERARAVGPWTLVFRGPVPAGTEISACRE